ncbi:hypothetical protein BC628DRAFT_131385 [Trametes gibbosa]|nr:hypothetical protein BC628DRAFT_131385 [Trametes gibbosa]
MPYNATIKAEARYAHDLGDTSEDRLHATYSAILTHWFPTERGYLIDHQLMDKGGKPEYIVVRHGGGTRNTLLIVELKRTSKWHDAGKAAVYEDLVGYIEGRFEVDLTRYDRIFGLGGIGLRWRTCEMEKSGPHELNFLRGWTDDISSDTSYTAFGQFADLVYGI